jgi:hypothetical protein
MNKEQFRKHVKKLTEISVLDGMLKSMAAKPCLLDKMAELLR